MSSSENLIVLPVGNPKPVIIPMRHEQYLDHLFRDLFQRPHDSAYWKFFEGHLKEFIILAHLDLDPVIPILEKIYSPNHGAPPRDPVLMLRSLALMTVRKVKGITAWVKQTRDVELFSTLAGFAVGDTPGVGTYYDFMKRIIDGPWHKPCPHQVRRTERNARKHLRNLPNEKEAKKEDRDRALSQSERLAGELLDHADEPRAEDFRRTLEDIFIQAGMIPSLEGGFLKDLEELVVTGDGSILESWDSGEGKPTCNCRSQGIHDCAHPRQYSSGTAEWCYDSHKDIFKFGDRYYHLIVHQSGHDFPLLTVMPGGNKSDYTLSLEAFDRFLKAVRENGLNLRVKHFVGDGHHDSNAHHNYFRQKGVTPVIPLSENSKKLIPHCLDDKGVQLDTDGVPLCPGGVRMRHHQFDKNKKVHVYACPVKRSTHHEGQFVYVTHLEECPGKKDCAPESSLGPLVYIKPETDLRLFPSISRGSEKYKELMNHRTSTERINSLIDAYNLEGAHANADYGLVRLALVNISAHAVIRYKEQTQSTSERHLCEEAIRKILAAGDEARDQLFEQILNRIFAKEEFQDTG